MVTKNIPDRAYDPVENLYATLEHSWELVCAAFDTAACLPDMHLLFAEADLARPRRAAEAVLVAMLQEVMEGVSRFSPWYRQPARAFGLASIREGRPPKIRWLLAPEAAQRWEGNLESLSSTGHQYSGVIHAMLSVADLMEAAPDDPCVAANCNCWPPRTIHIRRSVLEKTEIICDACYQPFV